MKYDLHTHTCYSKCSNMKPDVLLNAAKKRGLNGIAVTDHNTIKGALEVKKLNKDKDFEVIVGEEISTTAGDVLAHYINKPIKSTNFFELFDHLASSIAKMSKVLIKLSTDIGKNRLLTKKAWQIEQEADKICHEIYYEAHTNFITPIDREDIYALAHRLDNIVDYCENLISNMVLYRVDKLDSTAKKFINLIDRTLIKTAALINLLKGNSRSIKEMKKVIIEINSLENEGDQLIRDGFKSLFANHKKPILIIKWMDIFKNMEEIIDECENTGYIVEDIIVKNF